MPPGRLWNTGEACVHWTQINTTTTTTTTTTTAANLLEQLEQEECRRLEQLEQDYLVADAEVEADETTPWVNACWPEQFDRLPIEIIVRSALQPVPVPVAGAAPMAIDHMLGSWEGASPHQPSSG